jgi:solute carrier family 25 phosphate transporter 3
MTSSLPKPQKKIELFSANYFAACTIGGIIGK